MGLLLKRLSDPFLAVDGDDDDEDEKPYNRVDNDECKVERGYVVVTDDCCCCCSGCDGVDIM